jgi:S-formylglutathione hydrolase FrmB
MPRPPLMSALGALIAACGTAPVPPTAAPTRVASAAPVPVAVPVAHGPGQVVERTFHSAALGVDKTYEVYLPGGYGADPAARWPVIYYLHGLGGGERDFVDGLDLAATADRLALAAIIVTPDGDASFWVNGVTAPDYDACMRDGAGLFDPRADRAATCTRTANYEDYVVHDLIAHVDASFATRRDRGGRAIGGLSMGGFGALMLAMRHPDLFSAAASHAGVDALLYLGPHPYAPGDITELTDAAQFGRFLGPVGEVLLGDFGTDLTNWRAHDPATLAATLAPGALALYLDAGTEDELLLDDGAQYLHDLLTARGLAHTWHLGPGHHDFAFVRSRLDQSLGFFAAHFAAAR